MSVTERVMGVGSWDVSLRSETPHRIVAEISPDGPWGFCQLVITDVPVDVDSMTDRGMLGVARYTGIYRALSGRALSGAGLAALLGDERGAGNVFEAEIAGNYDAGGWASILTQWTGLTITGIQDGGTWATSFRWVTARTALADVCSHYGHEWRITPDFGYRQGSVSWLYPATPSVVVLTDDGGGHDWALTGVHGTVSAAVDVEDWSSKVVYLMRRDPPDWTTSTRESPYRDPLGRPLILDSLVEASVEAGDPNALAAAELGKRVARWAWTIDTDQDISRLMVGAPVWVWAPGEEIHDLTQQVMFRGRTIHPARSRLMGATWPIRSGMGVYLRRKPSESDPAVWLDLTPYVVGETGAVRLEIGAVPRGIAR